MKLSNYILGLLLCYSNACTSPTKISGSVKDSEAQSSDDAEEETVDIPKNISGVYLRCETLSESVSATEKKVGCNVHNEDEKVISLKDEVKSWEWGVKDLEGIKKVDKEEFEAGPFQVIYTINEFVAQASNFTAIIDLRLNDDSEVLLEEQIILILEELSNKRFARVAVTSIHENDGANEVIPFTTIEFKLNGEWLQLEAGIDGLTPVINIGKYSATIENAEFADMLLFLSLMQGGSPDITNGSTFSQEAPHNKEGDPMYFNVDFGEDKVSVQGIRFNGGQEIPVKNLPTGSLDVYHFEYSEDGVNWTRIKGGTIDLEKNPDFNGNFEIPIY